MSRILELEEKIRFHNANYWEKSTPTISDSQYDALMRELSDLDPENPLLLQVQTPAVASMGEVQHTVPMLSLDKAYSFVEIQTWAQKYARSPQEKFLIQPKYDGVSVSYEHGVLATRGDGFLGENITDKKSIIMCEYKGKEIPEPLANQNVRGELLIRTDAFSKVWSKLKGRNGQPYKNPRNTIGGVLTLKESRDIESIRFVGAYLTLVEYGKNNWEVSLEEMPSVWNEILTQIELLPYPMDGLVVKLADVAYADSLGMTAHHPRGQIAFKFTNVQKQSVLRAVEWSFGKNCLTPVATIDPIEIGGITIRHATLHNLQNMLDRDLHIGDTVIVERAGDVIPYIATSIPGENRTSALISQCPSCQTPLIQRGVELCCPNPECPETHVMRLVAAVKNLGIEMLGEPTIRKLLNQKCIHNLKDILNLKDSDLYRIDGFADLSVQNLLREIERAKTPTESQFIASLNIPGVGHVLAKKILQQIPFDALRVADADSLKSLRDIGPERAQLIVDTFATQKDFIDELLCCVSLMPDPPPSTQTICFTGKMPQKREYYSKIASLLGYREVSDVVANTSLLVCADPHENSSKLRKALHLGVPVQSLEDWLPEDAKLPVPDPQPQQDDLFGDLL